MGGYLTLVRMEVFKTLLVILATASLASTYCPISKMQNFGHCAYRFHCAGNIRGINLPNECQGAANYPVTVDVTLTDAIDKFDDNLDIDFINTITTLKMSGRWKETELSILKYMTKLQNFNISNNSLEIIGGVPFYYLSRIEIIDLSHNKLNNISELFQFQMHPNRLRKLSLAFNAIKELPGYAFEELTSLTELDLSYNSISDLKEEPFINLTNLHILRLNNNRIKDLNGAVNNLQNLKHLYLRGNQIENIDVGSLKIIIHLETFDVSWNRLEKIKPIIFSRHWEHFGNHSVCKIILSENHIKSIPNSTSKEITSRFVRDLGGNKIDILTELDLSMNSISKVEYNAFQSLLQLITLDLSRNEIKHFRVNTDHLSSIKYLNLSRNYITHLYLESFYSMNNLQNLDLSYNKLDYIPEMTFYNNNNLKLVNMTYNEIEKLDNIHIKIFHPEGGVLDLSNNGLHKLKIPYGEGIRLITLLLHTNKITDTSLIELKYQNDLRMLDLSKNLIRELNHSSLQLPQNIVYLDLTCNRIEKIGAAAFKNLIQLRTLRLGHNLLKRIEYGIFEGLSGLTNLDLAFNKIHVLDSKLLMDLKSLKVLSVRSNEMYYLEYKYWYSHNVELWVFVDSNNFTCEWLSTALNDYSNGYSKMKPVVLVKTVAAHTVEGIPCKTESGPQPLTRADYITVDERLLVTSQKILKAVKEQNSLFKHFLLNTFGESYISKNEVNTPE